MKEVEALDDFLRPPPQPRPIVRKALRIRVDVEGAAMAMQEAAHCAMRAARVARIAARRAKKCKCAAVYLGAARVSRDAAEAATEAVHNCLAFMDVLRHIRRRGSANFHVAVVANPKSHHPLPPASCRVFEGPKSTARRLSMMGRIHRVETSAASRRLSMRFKPQPA